MGTPAASLLLIARIACALSYVSSYDNSIPASVLPIFSQETCEETVEAMR